MRREGKGNGEGVPKAEKMPDAEDVEELLGVSSRLSGHTRVPSRLGTTACWSLLESRDNSVVELGSSAGSMKGELQLTSRCFYVLKVQRDNHLSRSPFSVAGGLHVLFHQQGRG
jgi:hypothetical protein